LIAGIVSLSLGKVKLLGYPPIVRDVLLDERSRSAIKFRARIAAVARLRLTL
jgi:hypothetical protein